MNGFSRWPSPKKKKRKKYIFIFIFSPLLIRKPNRSLHSKLPKNTAEVAGV